MTLFMLWTAFMVPLVASQSQDACYTQQDKPYLTFATDTPYEVVNDMNATN
jgi:hypothetical protein